jgi:hypothetical protein
MSIWEPNKLESDESRLKQRARIRELLVESYKDEHAEDPELLEYNDRNYGKKWKVRYYKMTESEFEEAKPFCFYIVFDQARGNVHYVELFCYDVRNLMRESMFRLDLKSGFVPIPLSARRWAKILELEKNIGVYTPYKGYLIYPLTKEETQNIYKNIKTRPMICTDDNRCQITSIQEIERNKFVFEHLFDESAEKRFGPPALVPPTQPKLSLDEISSLKNTPFGTPFVQKTPTRTVDSEQIKFIVDRVREHLEDLELGGPEHRGEITGRQFERGEPLELLGGRGQRRAALRE